MKKLAIRPGYPIAAAYVKPTKRPRRDLEGPVQKSIVDFLGLNFPEDGDVFWSSTLNGVKVTPKVRAKLRAQGLRKGVLDIVLIPLANHPRIGVAHWVECKSEDGRATDEQKALLDVLGPLGLAALCRSVNDVQTYLMSQSFQLRARV